MTISRVLHFRPATSDPDTRSVRITITCEDRTPITLEFSASAADRVAETLTYAADRARNKSIYPPAKK